jgi:uncharacterized protein (TIGR00730 family)
MAMKRTIKEYKVLDEAVDASITRLANLCSSAGTESRMQEILTTCAKLGMESGDSVDLKLINDCLKELRYSFKIFAPYRSTKKAILFGSARSGKDSAEYKMAEEFAAKITQKGYMVVTGGGPGVMEAGNKGAGQGKDFALNIRLPFEQAPNPYLDERERVINFKYFFTRKLIFIKETDATALFPGGFGTNDEGFEALTLLQTGKSRPRPVILMEPMGSTYWAGWIRFIEEQLVKYGFIDRHDLSLFQVAHSADEAVRQIEAFYSVYHSLRYVAGLTVLRLNRTLSPKVLQSINHDFMDILTEGRIEPSSAQGEELENGEFPNLPRLVMKFNLRDYGRLFELIRIINKEDPI